LGEDTKTNNRRTAAGGGGGDRMGQRMISVEKLMKLYEEFHSSMPNCGKPLCKRYVLGRENTEPDAPTQELGFIQFVMKNTEAVDA